MVCRSMRGMCLKTNCMKNVSNEIILIDIGDDNV